MILYHYSNKDIKRKLKISFFGENFYTKTSKNFSTIKRLYFYIDKNKKEYFFNGVKYCYLVKINKKKLYNLIKDKKQLLKKFIDNNQLFLFLKKQGYYGIIGNNGFNVAILWQDVKFFACHRHGISP